jgi:hypothetical protein
MSDAAHDDPGSRAFLEAEGFVGFQETERLQADRCQEVPNLPGVYAVVRESLDPPVFLPRSTAPVFRGIDPTRPIGELEDQWVPDAQLLYLGNAHGPGVRHLLKQRVKRYLRFGHGKVVAHWEGRFVWQLGDHASLWFAWKTTPGQAPKRIVASLLIRFVERYGVLPFANLRSEDDDLTE